MLAGTAGADEAMLCAFVAFDLGILERGPVRLLVFEPADILFHDLLNGNALKLFGTRMPCNAHESILRAGQRKGRLCCRGAELSNGSVDGVTQCAFDHHANQCLPVSPAGMNIVGRIDCAGGRTGPAPATPLRDPPPLPP